MLIVKLLNTQVMSKETEHQASVNNKGNMTQCSHYYTGDKATIIHLHSLCVLDEQQTKQQQVARCSDVET